MIIYFNTTQLLKLAIKQRHAPIVQQEGRFVSPNENEVEVFSPSEVLVFPSLASLEVVHDDMRVFPERIREQKDLHIMPFNQFLG